MVSEKGFCEGDDRLLPLVPYLLGRLANRTQEPRAKCECRKPSRLGIYELMIVDESMRGLITRRSHSTLLRDGAVAKGMPLLSKAGEIKIREGVTTREEVERVTMRAST